MQQAVTMSTAPPMEPPWMAAITGMRSCSSRVKVCCMSVSKSKMAARPSARVSSMLMALPKVCRSMPAEKCLPVLEITKARAVPSLCSWLRTSCSSRQKVGFMVFMASGRQSTRWATCASVVREKQLGLSMGCLLGFTVAAGLGRYCPGLDQRAHAHPQQADAAVKLNTLEALAGELPDASCIGRVAVDALVAGDALEVVVTDLDANGAALVAFAPQIGRHLFAQAGEDGTQFLAVAHRVQVALECCFAAHADRFALGHHRALVAAPGRIVQPSPVALAKVLHQPGLV